MAVSLFSCGSKTQDPDWANLKRYQKANTLLKPPKPNENRVVFMGNSITEAWSAIHPEFFEGKPYINRGISGQTTSQILLRFRQDVIALKPKVVAILAGTNDIAGNTGSMTLEQTFGNILSMIELAEANGIVPVVCSVLPAESYRWRPKKRPDIEIPKLNALLKKMALEKGVPYVDYFSAMANKKNGLPKTLAEDGVHPNKKGYEIMAPLVEAAIEKAFKK